MSTSPCEWVKKLVADPKDAEFAALSPDECAEVLEHVVICAACTSIFEKLRENDMEKVMQIMETIGLMDEQMDESSNVFVTDIITKVE